jgi:hypothetical protein
MRGSWLTGELSPQKQTNKQGFRNYYENIVSSPSSRDDLEEHYVRKQAGIIKHDMLKYHTKNCYLHTAEQALFSIFLLTFCVILPQPWGSSHNHA